MDSERPRDVVHVDARERSELWRHAVGNEVHAGGLASWARKVTRQREVRQIHPAVRRKVARDEQPGAHRSALRVAMA